MAGKGDSPRPVNLAAYETNYETIFRKCPSTAEQKEQEVSENGVTSCETQALMLAEGSNSAEGQTAQT